MLYEYYTGQLLIAKKKKEAKSEKAETGGFELILLAPGIERSTADPNENVPVGVYLPSPGGRLSKILARPVRGRRPFFHRGSRGLLCGWAVARSRCLRGSPGARERPVLKTYALTQSN